MSVSPPVELVAARSVVTVVAVPVLVLVLELVVAILLYYHVLCGSLM